MGGKYSLLDTSKDVNLDYSTKKHIKNRQQYEQAQNNWDSSRE